MVLANTDKNVRFDKFLEAFVLLGADEKIILIDVNMKNIKRIPNNCLDV